MTQIKIDRYKRNWIACLYCKDKYCKRRLEKPKTKYFNNFVNSDIAFNV